MRPDIQSGGQPAQNWGQQQQQQQQQQPQQRPGGQMPVQGSFGQQQAQGMGTGEYYGPPKTNPGG